MSKIAILIIDDDVATQSALRHVLDSDGWKVRIVALANQALHELASGDWALVIVNVSMTGLDGPLYTTLRELSLAPPVEEGRRRARVLFLVPELAGPAAQPALDREGLPYALKPLHLHDFLEKVSDLLLETQAIAEPIRRIREARTTGRRKKERRPSRDRRETAMFASRDDYQMTEEEITEYEKQEKEEQERKKKAKKPPEVEQL